jgi:DNA-binding LytR/AlgR family response regulator
VPLRLVLVDDEPLSRRALRQLLDRRADVTVVAECASSDEARAWLDDADAMLLDIEMPGVSGLDLARERHANALPAIVFVTAFDRYAVPAFATEAVDYHC